MKNACSFFILLCLSQLSFAGNRKDLLIKAETLIKRDKDLMALKEKFNFELKHVSFQMHADIQTVKFEQLYEEKTAETAKKEWRVVGGDVQVHFYPRLNKLVLDKRIYPFQMNFKSTDLIPDERIEGQVSEWMKIPYSMDLNKMQVRHRLLPVTANQLVPVLWIETKSLPYAPASVLVVNLVTGELIYKYKKQKHVEAETVQLPPIQVFDGRFHVMKSSLAEDKIDTDSSQFASVCQLISTNKNSMGEPVLVHVDQCDIGKDDSAKRAQQNSENILQYYLSQHAQYGFDNKPESKTIVKNVVHIGDHFDNAYWDEDDEIMVYGDGSGGIDKDSTNDYTLALDIAGHEFTHAIVSHTANFITPGDPGALNEAFADIFGVLISRFQAKYANWNIGAKLYHNQEGDSDEIALRSLSNPAKFKTSSVVDGKYVDIPFPDQYSNRLAQNQKCDDDNDQCEVHANSTIWSHAAYLIDQGFQDDLNYKSQDADKKMSDLYFITLTHKLRENETMPSAAAALLKTCQETMSDQECAIVEVALKKTELLSSK